MYFFETFYYRGKNMPKEHPYIALLKKQAKVLKKQKNIISAKALDEIAKQEGHSNWTALRRDFDKHQKIKTPTAKVSTTFVESGDIEIDEDDRKLLAEERKDELPSDIKFNVLENKKILAYYSIDYSIFEPTKTGLKKSILDATQPVRTHFELSKFHNYTKQHQGIEFKKISKAFFLFSSTIRETKMSLYRPVTKKGDPRMWFTALSTFADAGDQIAIIIFNQVPYLLNLSEVNLNNELKVPQSKFSEFIYEYTKQTNAVADELLAKLKELAKKPIKAIGYGDTTVGMSIECALGIPPNSSKQPDYKGIELKSGRDNKNRTRTTLFAQVADWSNSHCKSSAEILDKYGYQREDDFKLYCTLSTQQRNSQGLKFEIKEDMLYEWHVTEKNGKEIKEPVAVWNGTMLRSRLHEKHSETFWIEVESTFINDEEYFNLKLVTHTKSPLLNQLMPLIENGIITMDHLIKRNAKNNRVSEKGPLFKIDKRNLELLFPKPVKYQLN
jgi:hypothetical protein